MWRLVDAGADKDQVGSLSCSTVQGIGFRADLETRVIGFPK